MSPLMIGGMPAAQWEEEQRHRRARLAGARHFGWRPESEREAEEPAEAAQAPAEAVPDHLAGMNAADLMVLDLPPLSEAISGLLPEGLGVIGAPPKAGKSLLCYQVAVELVFGGSIFGIDAQRRDVRYYALEDGKRRSQSRLRALLKGRTAGLERLELAWTAPRLGGPLEAEVAAWLDDHPLGVVIIDVLAKVRPTGPVGNRNVNAYDADYDAVAGLHTVARSHPGSIILLVTHDRKAGSEDWMTRITGTRGVVGAADFVIFVSRQRTELVGTIFLTGRDVADSALDVAFGGDEWRLAGLAQMIGAQSKIRQTIYHWLAGNGPARPAGIAHGTGEDVDVIRHRLADMLKDGQVEACPQGYRVPADG